MFSLLQLLATILLFTATQQSNLKIITTPGQLGPEPCACTCVGTTGRETSNWREMASSPGRVWIDVDITACGFLSTPVVTVTLEGAGHHDYLVGTASIFGTSEATFRIILMGEVATAFNPTPLFKPTVEDAKKFKWNVNWSAFGYDC